MKNFLEHFLAHSRDSFYQSFSEFDQSHPLHDPESSLHEHDDNPFTIPHNEGNQAVHVEDRYPGADLHREHMGRVRPHLPYQGLSKEEIDKAADSAGWLFRLVTLSALKMGVSNWVFFSTSANLLYNPKGPNDIQLTPAQKTSLGVLPKIGSSLFGNGAGMLARENTDNTMVITASEQSAKAFFDLIGIKVRAEAALSSNVKINWFEVLKSFARTQLLFFGRAAGFWAAMVHGKTDEEKIMAAAVATAATTFLSNTGIRIGLNSFSFPHSTREAYLRSIDSFAKTQSATSSEMGLIEAVKKLIQGGRLTDEIKPPLRNAMSALNAGWLPGAVVAAVTAFIMSDTAKNAVNAQMREFITAFDEILIEHSKAQVASHEAGDDHHEDVAEQFEKGMQELLKKMCEAKTTVFTDETTKKTGVTAATATAAVMFKTMGSNTAARAATNNPAIRNLANVHLRAGGGILSTSCALLAREKMQKENFGKTETDFAVALIDQIVKMTFDIKGQQNNLIKKALIDSGIKISSLGKIFEANIITFPIFTLRSFVQWQAANKDNISFMRKAAEAGGFNFAMSPLTSLGIKTAYHRTQSAPDSIWEAYKISCKELGFIDVYNSIKNKSFDDFKKALALSISESYKGAIRSSTAVAIAAIILSPEFSEKLIESFDKIVESGKDSLKWENPFTKQSENGQNQEPPPVVQLSGEQKKVDSDSEKESGRK